MNTSADIFFPSTPPADTRPVSRPADRYDSYEPEVRDEFSALVEQENTTDDTDDIVSASVPLYAEDTKKYGTEHKNTAAKSETAPEAPQDIKENSGKDPVQKEAAPSPQNQTAEGENKTTPPVNGTAAAKNADNIVTANKTASPDKPAAQNTANVSSAQKTTPAGANSPAVENAAHEQAKPANTAQVQNSSTPATSVGEDAPEDNGSKNKPAQTTPVVTGRANTQQKSDPAPAGNSASQNPAPEKMISENSPLQNSQAQNAPVQTVAETVPALVAETTAPAANQKKTAKNNVAASTQNKKVSSKKTSSGKASAHSHAASSQNKTASSGTKTLPAAMRLQDTTILVNLNRPADPGLLPETSTLRPGQIGGQSGSSLLGLQDVGNKSLFTSALASKAAPQAAGRPVTEQLSLAISKNVAGGNNNFSIRLHPADLGQVDIRLEFGADGKVQALLTVDNDRTLNLLQRDQGLLEKTLQNAGFDTSNGGLDFAMKQNNNESPSGQASKGHEGNGTEQEDIASQMPAEQMNIKYSTSVLDISV